jgi:hypothetical protein
MHPHASRTVGLGDPQHGVTGAVTSSTCAGPARHRAARGGPGSRSQGGRPGATSVAAGVAHAVKDGTPRGSQRPHVDTRGINAGVH